MTLYPWLSPEVPAVMLAPMEGVTDAPMRALLTEQGGFTLCVSEFVRVSREPLAVKSFGADIPELRGNGRTPNGVPVLLQLLGGDPERLAISALNAVRAGAPGIDLNFGCPAPTVNRHDGGATLLKFPERIRDIVRAVRAAVPTHISVSAKLRLGWDDPRQIHLNAQMAAEGGASWITIHGRTRMQGYAPPAHWEPIGEVRRALAPLPVVANGDLWTVEDFLRCRDVTGCAHYMLGRSALADPGLARRLDVALRRGAVEPSVEGEPEWELLVRRLEQLGIAHSEKPGYVLSRTKQWLRIAHQRGRAVSFENLKTTQSMKDLLQILARTKKSSETPVQEIL